MWIRGPWWDSFWFLSSFPLGAVVTWFCGGDAASMSLVAIYFLVVFQMAHSISPYVLAWSHPEFRREMLRNKRKYIGLPVTILLAATLTGMVSEAFFPNVQFFDDVTDKFNIAVLYQHAAMFTPAWCLMVIYIVWNAYHFGMQNFGVMSIYRKRANMPADAADRRVEMAYFVLLSFMVGVNIYVYQIHSRLYTFLLIALMVVGIFMMLREAANTGKWISPRIIFALSQSFAALLYGPWLWAAGSVNHWTVAIGLSSHANGQRFNACPLIFSGGVIVAGMALFFAMFWRTGHYSWNLREMIQITTFCACLRAGTGIVHFLYDRWVWKLSDPQVRATIGRDLLKQRGAARGDQMAPAAAA